MRALSVVYVAVSLGLVTTLLASTIPVRDAEATITPKPGTEAKFPEAYLKYREQHPESFKIRGGLRAKVERARRHRKTFILKQSPQRAKSEPLDTLESTAEAAAPMALPQEAVVSGTVNVPVILVNYANVGQPYAKTVLDNVLFTSNP